MKADLLSPAYVDEGKINQPKQKSKTIKPDNPNRFYSLNRIKSASAT
ncbi:hypothetical protein [uncultured Shewanella sp.]|nr:hypothetical protein [uncultured Shewanella sp.]